METSASSCYVRLQSHRVHHLLGYQGRKLVLDIMAVTLLGHFVLDIMVVTRVRREMFLLLGI